MSRPRPCPVVLDSDDDKDQDHDHHDIRLVSVTLPQPQGAGLSTVTAPPLPPLPSRTRSRGRNSAGAPLNPRPTTGPRTGSRRGIATPLAPTPPLPAPPTAATAATPRRVVTLDNDEGDMQVLRPSETPSLAQRIRQQQQQQQQPIVLDDSQPIAHVLHPPQHQVRRTPRPSGAVPGPTATVAATIVLDDSQPSDDSRQQKEQSPQPTVRRRAARQTGQATPPAVVFGPVVLDDSQPLADEPQVHQRLGRPGRRRGTPPTTPAAPAPVRPATPSTIVSVTIPSSPIHVPSSDVTDTAGAGLPPARASEPPIVLDTLFSQDIAVTNETQHLYTIPSSSPQAPARQRPRGARKGVPHAAAAAGALPSSSPLLPSSSPTTHGPVAPPLEPDPSLTQSSPQDFFPDLPIIPQNLQLAVPSDDEWEFPADSQSQSQPLQPKPTHSGAEKGATPALPPPTHTLAVEPAPVPSPLHHPPASRATEPAAPRPAPTPLVPAPAPTPPHVPARSNVVRLNRPNPFAALPASAFALCSYCKQRVPTATYADHQAVCPKRPGPKLKKVPSLPKGQRTLFDMVPGASPKGGSPATSQAGTPGSIGSKGTPGSTGGARAAGRARPKVATVGASDAALMSPSRPTHPSAYAMRAAPPGPLPTPSLSGTSTSTETTAAAAAPARARWVGGTQWQSDDDDDDDVFAELGDAFMTQQAAVAHPPQGLASPSRPANTWAATSLPSPPLAQPHMAVVGDDSQGFAFEDEDPAVAAKAHVLNALGIQPEETAIGQPQLTPSLAPPPTQVDPLPVRKSTTSASRRQVVDSSEAEEAEENLPPLPVGLVKGTKRPSEAQGGRDTPPKQPEPVGLAMASAPAKTLGQSPRRPFPPPIPPGHANGSKWIPPPLPMPTRHTPPAQGHAPHAHHLGHPRASLPPLPRPPQSFHAHAGGQEQALYQARPRGTPNDPLMQTLRSQFGGGYAHVLAGGPMGAIGAAASQPPVAAGISESAAHAGAQSQGVARGGGRGGGRAAGRGRGAAREAGVHKFGTM